jgi:hypothetical protein
MICPLREIGFMACPEGPDEDGFTKCLECECAWYLPDFGSCAIFTLAWVAERRSAREAGRP